MKHWWQNLQPRERGALVLGSLALLALALYALLWEPWQREQAALRKQVAQQREDLAWMQEAATKIRSFNVQAPKPAAARSNASLLAQVDRSLRESVLAPVNKQLEPKSAQQVNVEFAAVDFASLIRWLSSLEKTEGIRVGTAQLERQDNTNSIRARLTLEKNQ